MFSWSKVEVWLAVVLAGFIVIGGAGHVLLDWWSGPRAVVVEARSGSGDFSGAASAPERTSDLETDSCAVEAASRDPKPPVGGGESRVAGGEDRAGSDLGAAEKGQGKCPDPVLEERSDDARPTEGEAGGGPGESAPSVRDTDSAGTVVDVGTGAVDERININTAPASELQRLPGIGPALSARIVDYRETWGPFSAVEDIMEVSGIGPAKFALIRDLIKVR